MERSATSDILAEMAAEPWAMEPVRLQAFFGRLQALAAPIGAIAPIQIARPAPKLDLRDGVAHIAVKGILLESVPGWLAFFGIEATAYGDIAALVNEAAASEAARRIELDIDSPGGTVAGVLAAARAIRAARDAKPMTARVTNLAASAAYWLASQADAITADLNDEIGSIGVYTVYYDASQMAAQRGVKVHVIASGEHKGMGVFGAPISESQLAAMQEVIDGIAENFVAAVAGGRGLERDEVQALATGRLWEAKAALPLKLIDVLGSSDGTAGAAENLQSTQQGDTVMSEPQKHEAPAIDAAQIGAQAVTAERQRLSELKAAFPNDLEFALAQFEAGATVIEAKAAYADVLAARLAAQEQTRSASAATGADGRIGVQNAEGRADGEPDFLAVSRAYAAEHGCTKREAMLAVRRANPALHERFLGQARARGRPLRSAKERIKD